MKRLLISALISLPIIAYGANALRVNQIGYLPDDVKAAVYLGDVPAEDITFAIDGAAVDSVVVCEPWAPAPYAARVYFTSAAPGEYILTAIDKQGRIDERAGVYVGADAYSRININELPLNYLRQQRCGYNPVHDALCHQHDGYLVLSGEHDGEHYDVCGGWHDASDYLQYLPTSANTVYQLLFGYKQNPAVWADSYDARGRKGANGIPDILDEARWGLEWMMRMNPRDGLYFNQIADDRDHRYVGVPQADSTDYGYGPGAGRPIYPVSGKPYGLQKYKNRSEGEASSVAKFASAFALGAELFADIDSAFAADMAVRATKAYDYAVAHPGASQTAPCTSPYFYEEDNWVDDVELAAATLGRRDDALRYAAAERVTPWMGADTARHYQWYPFVNLGHAILATESADAVEYMREGLEKVARRGAPNAFRYGIPFIWCSNNLAVAYVTQAMLYRDITGDDTFREAETAVRDWLFGVNPWGQMMVILPDAYGQSPSDPHSAMVDIVVDDRPGLTWLIGGIADGPVYSTIYNSLWGVHLRHDDRFAAWQGPVCVYHDDFSDYSTNEPTMDGTASLAYMLGRLAAKGSKR